MDGEVLYEDLDQYTEMEPLETEHSADMADNGSVHEYSDMAPLQAEGNEEYCYIDASLPQRETNLNSAGHEGTIANSCAVQSSNETEEEQRQEDNNISSTEAVPTAQNVAYSVTSSPIPSAPLPVLYEAPVAPDYSQMAHYSTAQAVYSEIPSQMPPPPPYWQAPQQQMQPMSTPVIIQPQFQQGPNIVHVVQPPPVHSGPFGATMDEYTKSVCILALVALIFSVVCAGFLGLICSVPAVIFAQNASTWKANGDMQKARRYKRCSIGCSIGTFGFIVFVLLANVSIWLGFFCGFLQIC